MNTFLASCRLAGKTVVPFATSGGSGMGKTNEHLLPSVTGAKLAEGRVFRSNTDEKTLAAWAEQF